MANVCIIPTGDRSGQANMIDHYCRLGFKVYFPLHGTGGLDWKNIATWPALLSRSLSDPQKRNLALHGFKRKEKSYEKIPLLKRLLPGGDLFGEDRFIFPETT